MKQYGEFWVSLFMTGTYPSIVHLRVNLENGQREHILTLKIGAPIMLLRNINSP